MIVKITMEMLEKLRLSNYSDYYKDGFLVWFDKSFKDGATIDELIERLCQCCETDWLKWVYTEFGLTGNFIVNYHNGRQCIKTHYINGKRHGDYESYHQDGSSCVKAQYVDGKRHGNYATYKRDGKLLSEMRYVDGKEQGEGRHYYYGSGHLDSMVHYKMGVLHGTLEFYEEDGRLRSKDFYINGVKQSKVEETKE